MSRPKKDARVLNIKLYTPVYDKLEQFCSESGMTKTMATEKILNQFFDEYFSKPEQDRKIL